MHWLFSVHWVLIPAILYLGEGIHHDTFVPINHKGKFDRELLRLLINGHILTLPEAVVFICYLMMLNKIQYSELMAIIVAVAMLVYCCLIFSFLKSVGTIIISIILVTISVKAMNSFQPFMK